MSHNKSPKVTAPVTPSASTSIVLIQHHALEAVSHGITIADAGQEGFPLIYANGAFCTIPGYAREEILGRSCKFLQGPETSHGAIATVREALGLGESCTVRLQNYRKDGTTFWNELTLTPVRAESGQLM